jgi:hypothetical protein
MDTKPEVEFQPDALARSVADLYGMPMISHEEDNVDFL